MIMLKLAYVLVLGFISQENGDVVHKSPIRLPELKQDAKLQINGEINSLQDDEWYVIESNVRCISISSPSGIVDIHEDKAPDDKSRKIILKGKMAGSTKGRNEVREYDSEFVYTIEVIKSGTVEIIIIPEKLTDEKEIVRKTLNVVKSDEVKTNVTETVSVKTDEVIITNNEITKEQTIEEPEKTTKKVSILIYGKLNDTTNIEQHRQYTSRTLRDYLEKVCDVDSNNQLKLRIFDTSVNRSVLEQEWLDRLKLCDDIKKPAIVINNTVYELPVSEKDTINLINSSL